MELAVRNDDGTYSAKEVDESSLKRKLTKGQMEDNEEALSLIEIFKEHLRYIESKENPLPFDELVLHGKHLMQMDDGPEKEAEIAVLRELYPIGSKAREELINEIFNLCCLSNSSQLLGREINREFSRRKYQVYKEYSKIYPEIKEYKQAIKEFNGIDFHEHYKPKNPKGLREAWQKQGEAVNQAQREAHAKFEQESQKVDELLDLLRVLYGLNESLNPDTMYSDDKEYEDTDRSKSLFDGISGFDDRHEENDDELEEDDEDDDDEELEGEDDDIEKGYVYIDYIFCNRSLSTLSNESKQKLKEIVTERFPYKALDMYERLKNE